MMRFNKFMLYYAACAFCNVLGAVHANLGILVNGSGIIFTHLNFIYPITFPLPKFVLDFMFLFWHS